MSTLERLSNQSFPSHFLTTLGTRAPEAYVSVLCAGAWVVVLGQPRLVTSLREDENMEH